MLTGTGATALAIVAGIVLGGAWGGGFGAASGALLAWLLLRSAAQQRQIAALQQALARLGGAPVAASPDAVAVDGAEPLAPTGETLTPAAEPGAPLVEPGESWAEPSGRGDPGARGEPAAAWRSSSTATAMSPMPPRADHLAPLWRWFFGGNTIVKAGVAVLFIGLAFLVKYASERVTLPVELRLASIGSVALVLLAIGWRLRHARAGYAQVLQGGAVAVLYLTVYAAFRYFGVLSVGPAFALMAAVAALAAALAVLQDAKALALVGALGGFATPLLLATGGGDHVALFGYYLVLDLGIAAVAWWRTWRALNLVGFVGTFLVGSGWGVLAYEPAFYASSQTFLIAFFLVFVAVMLMPARARRAAGAPQPATAWLHGSLLFGLPTAAFALQYGLVRDTAHGAAVSCAVLALFYALLALAVRARAGMRLVFEASLGIATVFFTLVIPFALDARSTAGAWALEAAGLVWIGFRQQRRLSRWFGYALIAMAGVGLALGRIGDGPPLAFVDATLLNALLLAAGALAAAYFVHRHAGPAGVAAERRAEPLLIAWGLVWLLAAAGRQIDAFVPTAYALSAWLASGSGIVLLCVALGARLGWPRITWPWPAMAHAPLLGVGASVAAGEFASPLAAGGSAWAWPLAFAVHAAVLRFAAPGWPAAARTASHAIGAWVVAALGALQGRAWAAAWSGAVVPGGGIDATSAWPWVGGLAWPTALLLWLARPAAGQVWPLRAAPAAYQRVVAGGLAAALLLATLVANVVCAGAAPPLPHLPLLNPLDAGIACALFAAWRGLHGAAAAAPDHAPASAPSAAAALAARVAWAGAGFVWLNAVLIRGFHHLDGVPFGFAAWSASFAVQTGIALLWTATALVSMWLAARRAARLPWLAGAALLAAVVLKLLLVDLSGSGTVTRIVSFIGVGVLMLVIGYVAPWPGGHDERLRTA